MAELLGQVVRILLVCLGSRTLDEVEGEGVDHRDPFDSGVELLREVISLGHGLDGHLIAARQRLEERLKTLLGEREALVPKFLRVPVVASTQRVLVDIHSDEHRDLLSADSTCRPSRFHFPSRACCPQ
jgi:hypothetical protein